MQKTRLRAGKEPPCDRLSALLGDPEKIGRNHIHPDYPAQNLQRHGGQAQEKQTHEHHHAQRPVRDSGLRPGGRGAVCAGGEEAGENGPRSGGKALKWRK